MTKPVKVKIWTGFGPFPELDLNKPYHILLYYVHNFIVKLVRQAAVGSIWTDYYIGYNETTETMKYTWVKRGWVRVK